MTTHYLEEAEALADQIVLLNQGRIHHQGSPAQIKAMASGKKLTFHWTESELTFAEFLRQFDKDISREGIVLEKRHCDGDKIQLTCHQPEALLKIIFNQGYMVSDLCIQPSRLEEAVVALSEQEKTLSEQEKALSEQEKASSESDNQPNTLSKDQSLQEQKSGAAA